MNNIRTVYDLMRMRSSLSVTCRNCDHRAFLSARFLKARLGPHARLAGAPFKCSVCQNANVCLTIAPDELSEKTLDPRMHFAGVYAKFENE